jgi:hypothetical protein
MIYEKELSERIIGFAFKMYNELGKGFLEAAHRSPSQCSPSQCTESQCSPSHLSPSQCTESQCSYSWESVVNE